MKEFILIGGIGSGKTTVAKLLEERGARLLDLDKVGHEVLLKPEVVALMTSTFGNDILTEDGQINRPKLAEAAFSTPANTIKLNAISQPRLLKLAQEKVAALREEGVENLVIEISVYDGPEGTFAPLIRGNDGIIAVTCPTRVRLERAIAKGFDPQDVKNRIARQPADTQRAIWSDYVISNKGTLEELETQTDRVWKQITS
ncbi:dephospho-CoA kinase [Curtanaerobium respiraculi]|jgi:dephospho-CoA kinase|uniref:dephospho-CoA kinase n=1 Tax=Curtanaerobium respiraculi TaxID=2949669 RepID=UPI0024B3784C|nr:dephospho-CoA kinase [Curtanaerobium respiraculi]